MISNLIKQKFKLWKSNRYDKRRHPRLWARGTLNLCKNHRRLATAHTSSLEDHSKRHRTITLNLLNKQVAHIPGLTREFLTTREGSNLHIRQQLSYCMHLQQLMSIHSSKLYLMKRRESMYLREMKTINEALSLRKPPPHTLSTLITCITEHLLSHGVNGLHDLTNRSGTHILFIAQLQSKHQPNTR